MFNASHIDAHKICRRAVIKGMKMEDIKNMLIK